MDAQKKILIVDDEPEVLEVLEKRLVAGDYAVVAADQGEKALALAQSENPDLIILDIDMPDMDGGEVAARLKDDDATKNIPVMFLSCLVTPKEQSKSRVGDSLFMAKPYNSETLMEGVETMLQVGSQL